MLKIQRFVNQLMTSNCYVVYDEDTKRCLVIDPASEKSLDEICFIDENRLSLDYILLTHEHTDHNWGVNSLRDHFTSCKLVCTQECEKSVKKANRAYFLLYYDDPYYNYEIAPADTLVTDGDVLEWNKHKVVFIKTPGHSHGSTCIDIDGWLFTGDTIMPYKPYFNGRDSNQDDWKESIIKIRNTYAPNTIIYPGHGDCLMLGEWSNSNY